MSIDNKNDLIKLMDDLIEVGFQLLKTRAMLYHRPCV